MPLDLTRVVIGGANSFCGSYLSNPICTAILIVIIILIILIWSYWKSHKWSSHITTAVYIFIPVLILLIAHSESIKCKYEDKFRNRESDELVESLSDQREQELLNALLSKPVASPSSGTPVPTVIPPQSGTGTPNT
jgi:c-di-AMP phosphodiesterase-like protein